MKVIHFTNGTSLTVNTLFCIGRNYVAHAKELNNPIPQEPLVFLKPNGSLSLEGSPILLPPTSSDVHHEVEIVVAIGTAGSAIPKESALEHVKGIGVGIDVTARDIQSKLKAKGNPWTLAKGQESFAPVSTFIPIEECPDLSQLSVSLTVNGEVRQSGNSSDMLFPIPELIAYISSFVPLQDGDLIFTGTPEGVSAFHHGDCLEASVQDGLIKLTVYAQNK